MDETIYGKCGYLSVKWEFRKIEKIELRTNDS